MNVLSLLDNFNLKKILFNKVSVFLNVALALILFLVWKVSKEGRKKDSGTAILC